MVRPSAALVPAMSESWRLGEKTDKAPKSATIRAGRGDVLLGARRTIRIMRLFSAPPPANSARARVIGSLLENPAPLSTWGAVNSPEQETRA